MANFRLTALVICLCFAPAHLQNTDPCGTKEVLVGPKTRSFKHVQNPGEIVNGFCDITIRPGWYRLKVDNKDVDLATSPPPPGACNTVYPIWMEAPLPQINQETAVKVCIASALNPCAVELGIKVKNCGQYRVYQLKPTVTCPSGYCFDLGGPCPAGTSSETGTRPGCTSNFPKLPNNLKPKVTPVLGISTEDPNFEDLRFECSFVPPSPMYFYDIVWRINGNEVIRLTNLRVADLPTSGQLLETVWKNDYNLGINVQCAIRARATNGGVPGVEHRSEVFYAGLKALNTAVSLKERETTTVRYQATVPIPCHKIFPCSLRFIDLQHELVGGVCKRNIKGVCGFDIKSQNWNAIQELQVTAEYDVSFGDRLSEIVLESASPVLGKPKSVWAGVIPKPVIVNIQDTSAQAAKAFCQISNDPHFISFDKRSFDVHLSGEFVLYRHKTLPLEDGLSPLFYQVLPHRDNLLNTSVTSDIHIPIAVRKRHPASPLTSHIILTPGQPVAAVTPMDERHEATAVPTVRGFFQPCGPTARCVCGAAVRSGKQFFVWSKCKDNIAYRTTRVQVYGCNQRQMRVSSPDNGRSYKVELPTGMMVDINTSGPIRINPSPADVDKTLGLCGNFNGKKDDEYIDPTGVKHSNACDFMYLGSLCVVNKYGMTWRINDPKQSYYPPTNFDLGDAPIGRCSCTAPSGQVTQAVTCDNVPPKQCGDIDVELTDEYCTQIPSPPSGRRKRRAAGHSEHKAEEVHIFPSYNETGFQIPQWTNGWNQNKAKAHCETAFRRSPVYGACSQIGNLESDRLIDFCVIDILLTGHTEWTISSLESYKQNCVFEARRNTTLWIPQGNAPSVLDQVTKASCPRECSFRGTCFYGECDCETGWSGDDCSIDVTKPPDVTGLSGGGLCDLHNRNCTEVLVYGSKFDSFGNITCRFTTGNGVTIRPANRNLILFTEGRYHHPEEIVCPVPSRVVTNDARFPVGYQVSVRNNNTSVFSAPKLFLPHVSWYHCAITGLQYYCTETFENEPQK